MIIEKKSIIKKETKPIKEEKPVAAKKEEKVKSNYFADPKEKDLDFISTGSTLFDCSLGGGWVCRRMVNVVGDRSSGKTLVAIEANCNHYKEYPNSKRYYWEAESAFDEAYAEALGMPIEAVEFVDTKDNTVEALFEHLDEVTKEALENKNSDPILYVVDSLDAISDRAERERAIDKGSFGVNKQKLLSEMFRRKIKDFEKAGITLMIISQVRENIGVSFGEKYTRSGGKSLDFYASQIVWLAEVAKRKKTIKGIERVVGIDVKINCKKNKVALPFRSVEYPVIFGFGIDDIEASLNWLDKVKATDKISELMEGKTKVDANLIKKIKEKMNASRDEYLRIKSLIDETVVSEWVSIETEFLPKERKY